MALGFDRLVMLATGASHIDQVQWTPVRGRGEAMRMNDDERDDLRVAAHWRRLGEHSALTSPTWSTAGLVPERQRGELEAVAARYAVAITPAMAELIDPADPADPIARQFVPDAGRADDDRRRSAPTRSATTSTRCARG